MTYLIQFGTNENEGKIRLLRDKTAIFDAYIIEDKFLDGCMFHVGINPSGELQVKAFDETIQYLEERFASVQKWEKKAFDFLKEKGYDNLSLEDEDFEDGWSSYELHLVESLDSYLDEYTLV